MKHLIIIYLLFCIVSCNQKNETITLKFSPEDSNILDERFLFDKITLEYKDSLYMKSFYGERIRIPNTFFYDKKSLYEYRHKYHFNDHIGIDSILTFSKKDTTFFYNSKVGLVGSVWDYAFNDCRYIIENKKKYITTTKQSTLDTTYKQIFYYDKNFRVFKYVNTYQENIAVYIPEE